MSVKKNQAQMLEDRIKTKKAIVSVVGLGYVGLPVAVEFANVGFAISGIDRDNQRVTAINSGKSPIDDVSDEELRRHTDSKKIKATTSFTVLKNADCISICVPTPLNKTKDPDVSYILNAVQEIKKYLHPGQLIVLESTSYPGTTEELILPILEETGLAVGRDFFLAFSPERVDPGNPVYKVKNTPKIVGGITQTCTRVTKLFYEQVIPEVIPVSSTKSAEMVKLLENTFRSVNIGLVNEVALMCDRLKIDVWEIIEAASTKPFGFMPFYPGPGLGGHCIPIDPHYLSWKLKSLNYYARFIELAGDINSHMPEYVVERINRALNQKGKAIADSKILVLGVAYKKDVKDTRESPALDVIKLLEDQKAQVSYNDPHVPVLEMDDYRAKSVNLSESVLRRADCVVILTDHNAYDYAMIVRNSKLVVDTRNATRNVKNNRHKIVKL